MSVTTYCSRHMRCAFDCPLFHSGLPGQMIWCVQWKASKR